MFYKIFLLLKMKNKHNLSLTLYSGQVKPKAKQPECQVKPRIFYTVRQTTWSYTVNPLMSYCASADEIFGISHHTYCVNDVMACRITTFLLVTPRKQQIVSPLHPYNINVFNILIISYRIPAN